MDRPSSGRVANVGGPRGGGGGVDGGQGVTIPALTTKEECKTFLLGLASKENLDRPVHQTTTPAGVCVCVCVCVFGSELLLPSMLTCANSEFL